MSKSAPMPSIYIPHGGGPAFFMQGEMRTMFQPMADFLAAIADSLPQRPSSILVISAHWETSVPTITGRTAPELIYDYGGFPQEMYELTYDAPGDPALAARVAALLGAALIENSVDPDRGWDHGVFIPLKVMYPDADIPVVGMSLKSGLDPDEHVATGRALAPLRHEGVLIVGSGMSWHNMNRLANGGGESTAFDDWLDSALAGDSSHRSAQLARWETAPAARVAHQREEHLIPLMVASGAGSDQPGRKLWTGAVGDSRVSAWAFD